MSTVHMQDVAELRTQLAHMILPWQEDGCTPANYVRKNGLGQTLAKVTRWLSEYQDVHQPQVIGWRVRVYKGNGGQSDCGLVPTGMLGTEGIEAAMEHALLLADVALHKALDTVMGAGKAQFVRPNADTPPALGRNRDASPFVAHHFAANTVLSSSYHGWGTW